MMRNQVFWRIVWKEYRHQRSLWCVIVLMALAIEVAISISAWIQHTPDWLVAILVVSWAAPTVYALGCGATLFAAEHEAETFAFQRSLPIGPLTLFAGKCLFGIASTLIMIVPLLISSLLLVQLPVYGSLVQIQCACIAAGIALALLNLSILFSLLIHRPLVATLCSLFCSLGLAWGLSIGAAKLAGGLNGANDAVNQIRLMALLLVLASVTVMVVNIWLGARWFREPQQSGKRFSVRRSDAQWRRRRGPAWVEQLHRLVWQQWCHSRWYLVLLVGGYFGIVVCFVGHYYLNLSSSYSDRRGHVYWQAIALLVPISVFIGCGSFQSDQVGAAFRFFADRGASARMIWLSRQLLGLAAVLSCVLLVTVANVLVLARLEPGFLNSVWSDYTAQIGDLSRGKFFVSGVAVSVGAYAIGQVCSMFLRNTIVAAATSLFATTMLIAWWLLVVRFELNYWITLAPILPILLWVTWLRAPDWVLERVDRRANLRAAASLVVPMLCVAVVLCCYRAVEVPLVKPQLNRHPAVRPLNKAQRGTANAYRRASLQVESLAAVADRILNEDPLSAQRLVSFARRSQTRYYWQSLMLSDDSRLLDAWLEANQQPLVLAIEASEQRECSFFDPANLYTPSELDRLRPLGQLMVVSGRHLESKAQLDRSLQHYFAALRFSQHLRSNGTTASHSVADTIEVIVYQQLMSWANHPQQSSNRISRAISDLDRLQSQTPPRESSIVIAALSTLQLVNSDDATAIPSALLSAAELRSVNMSRYLPWERVRTVRLVNLLSHRGLNRIQYTNEMLRSARSWYDSERIRTRWSKSNVPYLNSWLQVYLDELVDPEWIALQIYIMKTHRRAIQIRLALLAWKQKHGRLPERLDALALPNPESLIDPFNGRPFHYFPNGIVLTVDGTSQFRTESSHIPAGTPFIWSTKNCVREVPAYQLNRQATNGFMIQVSDSKWRKPTSEFDVWLSGWILPLNEKRGQEPIR